MTNDPDVETYGEDGVSRVTSFADVYYGADNEDERDDLSHSDSESGTDEDAEEDDNVDGAGGGDGLDHLDRAYPEMR